MKNKKQFFDLFLGVAAIVMILFSVKTVSMSNSREESNLELRDLGPAPSVLRMWNRSFVAQPDANLIIPSNEIANINKQFDYTASGEADSTTTFFPILYTVTTGSYENRVVYCIDVQKAVPGTGNDYTPNKASAALSYLAKNGFIGNGAAGNMTTNEELDYFATQVAVYSVLGQTDKDSAYENLKGAALTTVQNRVNSLVSAANSATFNVNFSSTGDKTLNKVSGQNYYESPLITVTANQNNPQITLTTSFTGAQILNENDIAITGSVASGTKIKIRVPEANLSTGDNTINVAASISAKIDQAYTYSTTAPTGNQPILLPVTFEEDTTGSGSMVFTANKAPVEEQTYQINIKKIDGDGVGLAGAKLVLKNAAGDIVKSEWTTTINEVSITGLTAGTYTITETSTPNGYIGSNDVSFTLPGDANKTINITNTKAPEEKGSLNVNKVDNNGVGLAGATIILQNSTGTEVGRFTTTADKTSHTFTDLPIGSYTIIESTAPVGYRKSDNISVTVRNNQETTQNVTNIPTEITIIKHDENNQPLAGAVLEVINSSGTVVYTWTTDNTGTHKIVGIPVGSYNVREKTAPEGYAKTEQLFSFTIQHATTTENVIIKNYKTVVKISKVDGKNNELIGGANLVVKDPEGNVIKSFVSDGTVYELYDLEPGTYTVEETKAPDGYALQTDKVTFTVTETSKEVEVSFTNNKLVTVPSTSFNIARILFFIGFSFVLIGGAFTYFYVKKPQDI